MILYYSIFKPSRFFFPISLSLSNVRYAYGEKEVLQQVSHTFKMGKKYVIVGPSGNEKSTLLNILNGETNRLWRRHNIGRKRNERALW